MRTPTVDFHVHVVPDPLSKFTKKGPIDTLRKHARDLWRPVSNSLHQAQTALRHLPEGARRGLDEISGVAPLVGLLFESTPSDLLSSMTEAGVDQAVVIAHPPISSNDFVMELCSENSRLIPVVNLPKSVARPGQALKKYAKAGAKALKIHPAADGEGVHSSRYKSLLKAAADTGLPVIIHTGCVNTHLFYKNPDEGHAERFAPWFKSFPQIRFVLAHMNFHEPSVALDLGEEHPNVYVDTSWQPAELIGEAVRRLGAERVLFATDWPFVGANLSVGMARVRDCIAHGTLSEAQSRLVLGGNALKLLGMESKVELHAT